MPISNSITAILQSKHNLILSPCDNQSNDLNCTFDVQNQKIHISMQSNDAYEINLLDQNYELLASVNNITHNILFNTIKYLLK
ncbi:MAG: hypothetical protein Q8R58_12660 [Sulfuricurvum sp.]|nr:hypothetical protein [Sulfuricurvum sp.]